MTTNEIGRITEAKVLARLVELGRNVLVPFSNIGRYDLVIEEKGKFTRVQCKAGRYKHGCVVFNTCSRDKLGAYDGTADMFGVWCKATGQVYLVPVKGAAKGGMSLRVDPPGAGNQTQVKWAKEFLL